MALFVLLFVSLYQLQFAPLCFLHCQAHRLQNMFPTVNSEVCSFVFSTACQPHCCSFFLLHCSTYIACSVLCSTVSTASSLFFTLSNPLHISPLSFTVQYAFFLYCLICCLLHCDSTLYFCLFYSLFYCLPAPLCLWLLLLHCTLLSLWPFFPHCAYYYRFFSLFSLPFALLSSLCCLYPWLSTSTASSITIQWDLSSYHCALPFLFHCLFHCLFQCLFYCLSHCALLLSVALYVAQSVALSDPLCFNPLVVLSVFDTVYPTLLLSSLPVFCPIIQYYLSHSMYFPAYHCALLFLFHCLFHCLPYNAFFCFLHCL